MIRFRPIATALVIAFLAASGSNARAGSCPDDSGILQRLGTESMLEDVAMVHSLDPALLSAIARVESNECSDAISPKGAAGLMQLMPATASEFGVSDRLDPIQNALGAARFIDYLKRDRPEGKLSLPEILAAYNAGEAAVTQAHGIPHYRETKAYVRRVLWIYLIGHVPESERAREAALEEASPPKPAVHGARVSRVAHHPAPGSDGEILGQLAEVRRARQAESTSSPNRQ